MASVQSDFIDVQLSATGIAIAGAKGALRISVARMSYEFKPGARVRVLTSEWAKILSRETLHGAAVFEVAPPPVAAAAAANVQTKPSQAEEAKQEGK